MTQEHVTDRLSDFMDGNLDGAAKREVEDHLKQCATCLGVLRDLEHVVGAARSLGPIDPPRDLWASVQDGIVRVGSPLRVEMGGAGSPAAPRVRRSVSIPQAAAAILLVSLMSAGGAWWLSGSVRSEATPATEARSAEDGPPAVLVSDVVPPELSEELRVLEAALERASADFDPNTRRILERNLSIIDRAIRESLEALATEPADPYLEEHLQSQMRRKVRVLRNATGLSAAD